jgi:ElaB/YqjD/DUF883 family membrane-anchored ribosome-binding protein
VSKNGKRNIMKTAELNTDNLITDLKRVVRDSEELLQTTAGAVGEKAHEVRERLSDTLEAAKRTCRKLEEKAVEGAKVADKTIREHPYQSIGVAFGVGLLIGVLATRK